MSGQEKVRVVFKRHGGTTECKDVLMPSTGFTDTEIIDALYVQHDIEAARVTNYYSTPLRRVLDGEVTRK